MSRLSVTAVKKALVGSHWSLEVPPAWFYRLATFHDGAVRIRERKWNGKPVRYAYEVSWYTGDPKRYWSWKPADDLQEAVGIANLVALIAIPAWEKEK